MPTDGFDLTRCLDGVRTGDQNAAKALVEHLSPLVFKIVRSHLPRRLDEEDLAQEDFLRVFTKIDQYKRNVPFEHWVSRVAVNACIDKGRFESRRPELRWADLSTEQASALDSALTLGSGEDPSQALASREVVEKLLENLSIEDCLVINLLDLEGHSVEEVSVKTGWNRSLIKIRAFRARRKLRKHLENLMETKQI
jgi:RNA polymerase sigma-70 factor, ECF subfamily